MRSSIFAAVADARGRDFDGDQAGVDILDAALDQLGVARDGAAEPEDRIINRIRAGFGTLHPSQIDGIKTVLTAMSGAPLAYTAYALATAWWETNKTMQPVREAYWLSEAWRKKNLRYWPHYGRGYVQLTWLPNYAKADAECTKAGMIKAGALIADPDLALRPDIAAFIMRKGMDEGWFTGKSFATYLPASGPALTSQFKQARKIINGTDKDDEIAAVAFEFQKALA